MTRGRGKKAYEMIPQSSLLADIGCATAGFTDFFKKKSPVVFGLDISFDALKIAKLSGTKVFLLCASAEALPLKSKSLDTIVMLDVFEHVNSEVLAVKELERVLRKGGYLCISVPYKGLFSIFDVENWRYHLRMILYPRHKRADIYYHRHYTIESLKRFFADHTICQIYRSGLILFPLCLWLKRLFSKLGVNWLIRPLLALEDLDYAIEYGGYAFNIMMLIRMK